MSLQRRARVLAAASALGIGLAFAGATTASAIIRVPCNNYNDAWVHSNQTTCWAYEGGKAVSLLYTIGASGGINNGHVIKNGSVTRFYAHRTTSWPSAQVTYIAIY